MRLNRHWHRKEWGEYLRSAKYSHPQLHPNLQGAHTVVLALLCRRRRTLLIPGWKEGWECQEWRTVAGSKGCFCWESKCSRPRAPHRWWWSEDERAARSTLQACWCTNCIHHTRSLWWSGMWWGVWWSRRIKHLLAGFGIFLKWEEADVLQLTKSWCV